MAEPHDPDIDFVALMREVALRLLGAPNRERSNGDEWRYGTHGSTSINIKQGIFFDHEESRGGGTVDLIEHKLGLRGADAIQWLRAQGLIQEAQPKLKSGANGRPHTTRPQPPQGDALKATAWEPDHVVAIYEYCDQAGELLFHVLRIEEPGKKKTFLQRQPAGDGKWVYTQTGRQVPYRLPKLLERPEGARVYITEGEKDADGLAALGLCSTTNPGGASKGKSKWKPELNPYFEGADVVILPDNDETGRVHSAGVARALEPVASSVRIVNLPGLAVKEDVSDWLDAGGTCEDLSRLADAAPVWCPKADAAPVDEPLQKLKRANVDIASVDSIEVVAWPEPGELPHGLPEVPSLTTDMLPAGVRNWVADVAERMQCPIEFAAVAALVAASSLIGRQLGIRPKRHDDWTVTPNLWGGVVGPPGVMKSPALKEMLRPITAMEDKAAQAHEEALRAHEVAETVAAARASVSKDRLKKLLRDRKDDEALMLAGDAVSKRVSPERRRYIANDSTVEKLGEILAANPRGVLIFRDELSGWLRLLDKDGREADRAFYLEAWEGNGRFTYDRIGRGTIDISACCVSMLGGIQPGVLSDYIAAAVRGGAGDDGLVQRFQLLVWPDVSQQWRNVDRQPAPQARDEYQAAMFRLAMLDAEALEAETPDDGGLPFLRYDGAAQDLFDTWRHGLELRLRSGELIPALESHLAKFRSLVPSLALIFHLLAGNKGPVGHACLHLALQWAEFLEGHAVRLYSVVVDADAVAARRLAAKILKREVSEAFTGRDIIRRGWSGLTTTKAIQGAIDVLIELGWLREVRRNDTGGRPSVPYFINPKLPRGPSARQPEFRRCLGEATDKTDERRVVLLSCADRRLLSVLSVPPPCSSGNVL